MAMTSMNLVSPNRIRQTTGSCTTGSNLWNKRPLLKRVTSIFFTTAWNKILESWPPDLDALFAVDNALLGSATDPDTVSLERYGEVDSHSEYNYRGKADLSWSSSATQSTADGRCTPLSNTSAKRFRVLSLQSEQTVELTDSVLGRSSDAGILVALEESMGSPENSSLFATKAAQTTLHKTPSIEQPQHHLVPSGKAAIPRARFLSRTSVRQRDKANQERHLCNFGGCTVSSGRLADLKRHQEDVHRQGEIVYKCDEPGCPYAKMGRSDKVREHCKKRKHQGFSAVEASSVPNGVLSPDVSSRRKSGDAGNGSRRAD